MSRQRHPNLLTKSVLSVGFLALGSAVLAAHGTPATGYEVSIYAGTPPSFWVGFALSLLISLGVALTVEARRWRRMALVLGAAAMVSFVSLPVIHGYYFYASADTLSHLGWGRDIVTGVIEPVDLFYPGIHVLSALVYEGSGFTLPRSLMLVAATFVPLYFVFVTLCARTLTNSGLGTAIGAISAFLLLPINVIVVKLSAHPISQTVLYSALVLFLLFKYLSEVPDRVSWKPQFSGIEILFLVALTAIVLYHPLGALIMLVLFVGISVAQFVFRRWNSHGLIGTSRPLYVPTLFLALWLGFWAGGIHPGLIGQSIRIAEQINTFVEGGSTAGGVVARQQSSIRSVGASMEEIFVKLFLVSLIYAALTAAVMALSLVDWFEERYRQATVAIKLLTLGFVVLVPWSLAQFIGNISNLYFRYVGFMMVVGTIFGAFAIFYLVNDTTGRQGRSRIDWSSSVPDRKTVLNASRIVILVGLVAMLAFTTAFNYPSARVYQPSGHMSESLFDGHEMILELNDPEYELSSIGYRVTRYRHATEGTTNIGFGGGEGVPSPKYDHDLVGYVTNESIGDGRYLILSDRKRIRRVAVYRGFRYNRTDFRAVETGRGINRVFTNGNVELYLHTNPENNTR